jgi:hypothetical protein
VIRVIVIIVVVVLVLGGGLLTLRSTRNLGAPTGARLERAKLRAREQAERDEAEKKDA